MSKNSDFSMTIERVVEAPPHGVMVTGTVTGSAIHIGDAVQVKNGQLGRTVQVEQIAVGVKAEDQASPGMQAVLLLEGLSTADIHSGDQLVSGREEDIIQPLDEMEDETAEDTDEEEWPELPERDYPIRRLSELAVPVAALAFFSLFLIVPIWALNLTTNVTWNIPPILFFLVWYGGIGSGVFFLGRWMVKSLQSRRLLQAEGATAMARILRRRVVESRDDEHTHYSYQMQIEFSPSMAQTQVAPQQYMVRNLTKSEYERLEDRDTVQVTYATSNPQIFVIEGE